MGAELGRSATEMRSQGCTIFRKDLTISYRDFKCQLEYHRLSQLISSKVIRTKLRKPRQLGIDEVDIAGLPTYGVEPRQCRAGT